MSAVVGDRGAANWPYQSYLELGAINSAVPCARLHTRLILQEWGLPFDMTNAAELIVSELVTNVLEHGLAGLPATVQIWISSDGGSTVIYVWDGSPMPPVRTDAGPDADSGRGLMIIEALSTDWGCQVAGTGKVVWAAIDG
jgi:anti-sigma regulatory factor (Ser/Thr protein kinase)